MSGSLLDGLRAAVKQEDRESYEPGKPHEFQAIIDSLVRQYDDGTLKRLFLDDCTWALGFERVVRHITPSLVPLTGRHDALDSFLECLFAAACRNGESLEYLLDPVVQALYILGHNNVTIDLSYDALGGTDLASCLESVLPDDDALALTVRAAGLDYFGWQAHYCDLTLMGDCRELGPSSDSSLFRLRGEATGNIGMWAENTEFYVTTLGKARVCPLAISCRVYTDDLGEGDIPFGFSRGGNRLYLADGKGGWTEVEP